MKNLIVGLTSPARGGKDMVANILETAFRGTSIDVVTRRFADPLKGIVAGLFGWDRARLSDDIAFKETPDPRWGGITPRKAMQLIGTEMFRAGPLYEHYGIDIWVRLMQRYWEDNCSYPNMMLVIPDCRFQDEFDLIKELGGVMVFMDPRPRIREETRVHASERDMWRYKEYDHVIDTGGTMEKTRLEAETLAQHFYNQLMMED